MSAAPAPRRSARLAAKAAAVAAAAPAMGGAGVKAEPKAVPKAVPKPKPAAQITAKWYEPYLLSIERIKADIDTLYYSKAPLPENRATAYSIIDKINALYATMKKHIKGNRVLLILEEAMILMEGFIGIYSDGREECWEDEDEELGLPPIDYSRSYLIDAASHVEIFKKEIEKITL
jgi:hypothetical protein